MEEAERGVTNREGDSVSVIPAKQAVIRALQNTALKGNPHAQRTWTLLYAPIEREKAIEIKAENEFWEAYQQKCREEIKEAESKGAAPPLHLPHPDDIIIRYGKPPLFTGPTNEAELKDLEERIKLMNAFIMQIPVNERCALPENIEAGLRCAEAATLFVALLNGTLPKRLQLSDTDFITKARRRAFMSRAAKYSPGSKSLVRSSKGSRTPMLMKTERPQSYRRPFL